MEDHIRFDRQNLALHLLDQRILPEQEADIVCRTTDDVIYALQTMVVRGAPAIGVTAAWGCALALNETSGADWATQLEELLDRLANARPTAVNLRWAVDRMRKCWWKAINSGCGDRQALLPIFLGEAGIRGNLRRCHPQEMAPYLLPPLLPATVQAQLPARRPESRLHQPHPAWRLANAERRDGYALAG